MALQHELYQLGIIADSESVEIPSFGKAPGQGKAWYISGVGLAGNTGSNPSAPKLTLAAGKAKLRTGKNDTLRVLPSSTSIKLASNVDWSLNLCHLRGDGSFGRMNQRARFEMSTAFATMMTVSGYGNSFSNFYIMHGTSSATNLVGLSITGQRNSFYRMHVLPQDATACDQAGYRLVSIDQSEQYFKECVFGGDGLLWTNGAVLQLGATSDGGPPRVMFEDCLFLMRSDNAQAAFLDCALAGLGEGLGYFSNCHFVNIGTSLTYGILGAGLSNYHLFFDNRCSFAGVTDVVAAAYENYVWFGGVNMPINQVNTASVALFNGLACHPDVS